MFKIVTPAMARAKCSGSEKEMNWAGEGMCTRFDWVATRFVSRIAQRPVCEWSSLIECRQRVTGRLGPENLFQVVGLADTGPPYICGVQHPDGSAGVTGRRNLGESRVFRNWETRSALPRRRDHQDYFPRAKMEVYWREATAFSWVPLDCCWPNWRRSTPYCCRYFHRDPDGLIDWGSQDGSSMLV